LLELSRRRDTRDLKYIAGAREIPVQSQRVNLFKGEKGGLFEGFSGVWIEKRRVLNRGDWMREKKVLNRSEKTNRKKSTTPKERENGRK